ncbi:unnamed protein product [Acanthoscelides obtectus]|uniref:Endonuclease/exonuclease/phosphatase domain-containing protein n=1 Tax=Acanthoscelides obtectus TaxID=200917 RepID=A0A9P0M941_ACAOB|nr:unnamed protein product [Acanthoscelides obtectus]CAK1685300.1 RNA-directed DNA polymerase from mobile element jockey [Acanthoscelides obtectus]
MKVCSTVKFQGISDITFVSVYIKPQTKITKQEWIQFFSSLHSPCIIGGDFNAHHTSWGCAQDDVFGKILIEALDDSNLSFINNADPTYVKYQSKSAIDLTLCTPQIHHQVEWRTLPDPCGSDHLPILINCNFTPEKLSFASNRKWNINKACWNQFCFESINRSYVEPVIDYSTFIKNVNQSAEASIPKYENKNNVKGKPWWTNECNIAVEKR